MGDDGGMPAVQPEGVSVRESEVLAALAEGRSNAQIAHRLHLSVRTVESHVSSLLRKYGVADRRALAALAGVAGQVAAPGRIAGVPAGRTTFVGRAHERDAVHAALSTARLVTLVGPGGIGKTRLAAEVAAEAAPEFPVGGAFVDLVPVRDGFVAQAAAAALGVTERHQQRLAEAVRARLGHGRSLLVLDNCEHVLDPVAALVDQVLAACPETTVLATSRERLGLPGEHAVPLAPLPLASDAEQLFRDRAGAADPGFAAEPALVAEVCARLDGMPLAIELAAARAPSLGATGLLAALDDRLRLLAGGRSPDARHRSMRAVLEWSHALLDPDEQAVFRRLAVFAGGFDLDAVVAVDGLGTDGNRAAVADVLGRLSGKSLLVPVRDGTGGWRMLETVRAFAADRLAASGEADTLRDRHLGWAVATAAALDEHADAGWRDRFDAVAGDLRSALAAAPPGPTGHRLARLLAHLAYRRRFLREALDHWQQAADRAPSPAEAARDLRTAADCAHAITHAVHSYELLLAASERARAAGDRALLAMTLADAVMTAYRLPGSGFPAEVPPERLGAMLGEAETLAAGDDDPVLAAHLAAAEAWGASAGRLTADPALAGTAAVLARKTGDPVLISAGLDALGTIAAGDGRYRDAYRISTERLALLAVMDRDDPRSAIEIVDVLHVATADALSAGELPAALAVARQAMADDLIGDHPYLSTSKLIPPLVLRGEVAEALRHADTLWEGWQRAGRPAVRYLAPAVSATALAHGLAGDQDGFREWRSRALAVAGVADAADSPDLAAFAAFVDARVAVHTGAVERAPELVSRAFAVPPARRYAAYAHATGAELAVVAGLPDATARIAAAAGDTTGNPWAAACLTRARWRLGGSPAALPAAIAGWQRLGARFEVEYTRTLA
ncbi:MAG: ATP-binding protein [Mycobacteriales bacterium]